jgi:hypothetical protein
MIDDSDGARHGERQSRTVCSLCGWVMEGERAICPYHYSRQEPGWAIGNRIMCDFLYRGILLPEPTRLAAADEFPELPIARLDTDDPRHAEGTDYPSLGEVAVEASPVSRTRPPASLPEDSDEADADGQRVRLSRLLSRLAA